MIRVIKLVIVVVIGLFLLFAGRIFWLQQQEYTSMDNALAEFDAEMSGWHLSRESAVYYPLYPISDIVSYVYAEYSFTADTRITEDMIREKFSTNHDWREGYTSTEADRSFLCEDIRVRIRETSMTVRIDGWPVKDSGILPMIVYEIPDHCFP